jgi:Zn-dependent protease
LIYTGIAGITINLVLMLINLLPIPPLDGGRVLSGLLPAKWARYFNQLERFGFIILLLLIFTGGLSAILGYPLYLVQNMFFSLAGL